MGHVRWGILSTANIALTEIIPAFNRSTNARVTAIASGKAKEVADKFGISKAHYSYEELLNDPEVDGVYIPLPNHLHKNGSLKQLIKVNIYSVKNLLH
ncbi:Gfo/Idh/MocA family protein [Virgibacillus natechei]